MGTAYPMRAQAAGTGLGRDSSDIFSTFCCSQHSLGSDVLMTRLYLRLLPHLRCLAARRVDFLRAATACLPADNGLVPTYLLLLYRHSIPHLLRFA